MGGFKRLNFITHTILHRSEAGSSVSALYNIGHRFEGFSVLLFWTASSGGFLPRLVNKWIYELT